MGYGVAWSKGGIAFAARSTRDTPTRIGVVQPDGRGLRTVSSPPDTNGPGDSLPAWSADGT
jgi:hypothetical protein